MYAKIFRQIYGGTLATEGPWEALVTFQQMLILADSEGTVDMTSKAISRETTIPLEIIEKGLTALELPDPESRSPAEGGRRILKLSPGRNWGWKITNYEHYRKLRREEDRRAYHREYWHKRKTNSTETQHDSTNSPIADAKADAEAKANTYTEREKRAALSGSKRFPEDFDLTPERRQVAASFSLEPASTFAKFKDHYIGTGDERANWEAVWRNWCRRELSPKNSGPDKSRSVVREAVTRARIGDMLK